MDKQRPATPEAWVAEKHGVPEAEGVRILEEQRHKINAAADLGGRHARQRQRADHPAPQGDDSRPPKKGAPTHE